MCFQSGRNVHSETTDLIDAQALFSLHVSNVLQAVVPQLLGDANYFKHVFEHVIRVEFQGRGTLHIHIALWAIVADGLDLRGTSGQSHDSPIIRFLENIGFASVDVQYGEGFLNYINGYTSKASDALDFRLKEHTAQDASHQWRMTYRLMCKHAPCVPEIACHFAGLQLMRRSFGIEPLYAPVPRTDIDLEQNTSLRLYGHYLKHWCPGGVVPMLQVTKNLLQWARTWRLYDDVVKKSLTLGRPSLSV